MRQEDIDKMPLAAQRTLEAAADRRLSGGKINLLAMIGQKANDAGEFVVTYRRLAEIMETSTTSIQQALADLERYGYIAREGTAPRRSAPTRIRILPPSKS